MRVVPKAAKYFQPDLLKPQHGFNPDAAWSSLPALQAHHGLAAAWAPIGKLPADAIVSATAADSQATDSAFPREARLLTKRDFSQVFENNQFKRNASPMLMLCYLPKLADPETYVSPEHDGSRLGVIVAKKQVKRAHERNRLKRIAREQFRHLRHQLPVADIILLFRKPAQFADSAELGALIRKQLLELKRKHE